VLLTDGYRLYVLRSLTWFHAQICNTLRDAGARTVLDLSPERYAAALAHAFALALADAPGEPDAGGGVDSDDEGSGGAPVPDRNAGCFRPFSSPTTTNISPIPLPTRRSKL
jgi:hypothetical protein